MIRSPYFFIIAFLGILVTLRVEGERRLPAPNSVTMVMLVQMAERAPASQEPADPQLEVLLDALESDLSGETEGEDIPQFSTDPEFPLEIEELSISEASSR